MQHYIKNKQKGILDYMSLISKKSSKKIIIIGAGIAGLAACTKLNEHGFNTKILEAKNHAGGRIDTDFQLGVAISRGAGWIHGATNNPITQFAKHLNMKMMSSDPAQFVMYDKAGSIIPLTVIQAFNHKFDEMLQQAKILAQQSTQDISLADALSKLIAAAHFSSVENDLFQAKLNYFQGYLGADYDLLSALHWDQEEVWPGENCFLIDSYHAIITNLARNCELQLNTVVTQIKLHDQQVEIITKHDTYYADAVIITLPLGVLKSNSVMFNPPLPEEKILAIQRMGMGLFNIVALKFPSIFWPTENQALYFSQFDSQSPSFFLNLNYFIQQPILLGYCGGDKARYLESISDDTCIKNIMSNLKNVFGKPLPDPEMFFVTRWGNDDFSCGSYSYVATGSSSQDFDTLANPVANRLFFAGEATCGKYLATTHGAYLSGVREAERIIEMFK